jgi:hypothetical protein
MRIMLANTTGIKTGYLAGRYPGKIGHLHSPQVKRNPPGPFTFLEFRFALDNGAFAAGDKWSEDEWMRMLEWAKLSGQNPLWALVPDVVGDRDGTLAKWTRYAPILRRYGWPLAFAAQDGMTSIDVPGDADVVFVGGSTDWKWKTVPMWCGEFERVHVGRVNTYRHLWKCDDAGAESCDGTGWMRDVGGKQYRGLEAYLAESAGSRKRVTQISLFA